MEALPILANDTVRGRRLSCYSDLAMVGTAKAIAAEMKATILMVMGSGERMLAHRGGEHA